MAAAIFWFAQAGYVVNIPMTDSQSYDLIVEKDGLMQRVQVRTTTKISRYGVYWIDLRTLGGNQSFHTVQHFDPQKVELVFAFTQKADQYLIPALVITNKSSISLGTKYESYRLDGLSREEVKPITL